MPPNELMQLGWEHCVDEVVVPDVISNNAQATIHAMHKFFEYVDPWPEWSPRFAAVVHGSTVTEAMSFVDYVAEAFPLISTLSLAKKLPEHTCDLTARTILTQYIKDTYGSKFDVHFLGYNPQLPQEIQTLGVRSMDTAAPYSVAYKTYGADFQMSEHVRCPRPPNYFQLPASEFDPEMVERNIHYIVRMTAHE
jgi:hypothetical protein